LKIKEQIDLFNRAFALAWCKLPAPSSVSQSSEMSERLAGHIRSAIKAGLNDVGAIADTALNQVRFD
jgi:hypothetical protein